MTHHGLAKVEADRIARRHDVQWQHDKVRDVGEQKERDDERHGDVDDPWQIPSRIAHLAADVIGLIPAVESP